MQTKWMIAGTVWTALAITACGDDDGSSPAPDDTSVDAAMGTNDATSTSDPVGNTGIGATGAIGFTHTPDTSTSVLDAGPVGSSDAGLWDAGATSPSSASSWEGDSGVADAGAFDAGTADGGLALQLTDGEIVAIVQTANSGEIMQGELAMENALSASVAEFAEHMVMSHTTAQSELDVVALDSEIEPQPNVIATNLEAAADQVMEELTALEANTAEFDLAYMAAQISQHTVVLQTIRQQLLVQADDPELVTLLGSLELEVEAHLETAQDIMAELVDPEP